MENGRTYVNDTYYLPNDDDEETRRSIVHQINTTILSGRLTLHRIKEDVSRILDIGTKPGDWAIAMAERYPNAEIVATDLSPFEHTNLPPNLTFQIDDARAEWTFTEAFDLIHIRNLKGAFSDWRFIYSQANKHLGEDGILEVMDKGQVQHYMPVENSYLDIYNAACQSAAEIAGIGLGLEHLQKEVIEGGGLRIFRTQTIKIPVGQWDPDPRQKSIGKMALVVVLERLEAQSIRLLTKYLGWSVEEVKDLCSKVQQEILHPQAKPYMNCTFIVARKFPLAILE